MRSSNPYWRRRSWQYRVLKPLCSIVLSAVRTIPNRLRREDLRCLWKLNCYELILISTLSELHDHAKNRDLERFDRLKGFINNPEALQLSASSLPSDYSSYSDFHSVAGKKTARPPIMLAGNPAPIKPMFRESPFYTILEPLTDVYECKGWLNTSIV